MGYWRGTGAYPWRRHQIQTFPALLAICAGNSPVPGEFPAQRPVARSFHVFFDLRLNRRLSKQSWGWWFETLLRTLWRHCNAYKQFASSLVSNFDYIHIAPTWMEIRHVIRISHMSQQLWCHDIYKINTSFVHWSESKYDFQMKSIMKS